jgi:hypothetical protein
MKKKKFLSAAVSAAFLMNCAAVLPPAPVSAADAGEVRNMSTLEIVQDMGIGINLGNTMEATGDWITGNTVKDYETAWGSPVITKDMIQGYHDEGFGVVRIPVAWSNLMSKDGKYTISSELMDRVTQIVDWTLDCDMYAIVNIHWDGGWLEKYPDDPEGCLKRFEHMWEQISDNFKDYGDHLMFEAQNEELGWNTVWNQWSNAGDKEKSYGYVNDINKKFVDTVRASGSNNTYRHLLLSGYNTAVDLTCDPLFELPYDPVNRLAVSVHYYTPSTFAILEEDADWGKAQSTWGTDSEVAELKKNMKLLKETFVDKGTPVIIGEYGCPTKNKDKDSVRKFLQSVCTEAVNNDLCPVLWDTPEGSHYDRSTCKLRDSEMSAFYQKMGADLRKKNSGEATIYYKDTFESGTDNWTGRGSAKVASSSDASCEGSKSIYVSGRESAWNGAAKSLGSDFVPGKTYSFSANVMYNSGGASDIFYMKLQYEDAAGKTQYSGIAEVTTVKGVWNKLVNNSYTIPEGASKIQIYIETANSTNSFYVDEAIGASEGALDETSGVKKFSRGDLNFDGIINVFDLILAKRMLHKTYSDETAAKYADVDGNGKFEINDVVLINQFLLRRITEFPTPPKPDNKWDDYTETASADWINFYKSGICNMGNTERLVKKLEAAEDGKSLTLAYLGGSITEGKNYSSPFSSYIKNTFCKGSFTEVNAGLSGTSSVVGLVRSEKDIVSKNPDIVVIEFSVNDHEDILYKKAFESLIKKFLSLPNEPAVIALITTSKGGYSSQTQMEKVGKQWDIPVISMHNALQGAFKSGFLKTGDYFTDEYHPHKNGGQIVADAMAYYVRQAMRTENRSDEYVFPSTPAYGAEYYTCINADPSTDLQSFNAGSFSKGTGYSSLPYGYTSSGGSPMTFKMNGKGLIIVFKANSSGMGSINVTVNGKTTKINGKKQYTWGGPDAELGYYQDTAGDLDVSISASGSFTIWGLGVVK